MLGHNGKENGSYQNEESNGKDNYEKEAGVIGWNTATGMLGC